MRLLDAMLEHAGLLPKAFSAADGGTQAAPAELNNENQPDARLVLPSIDTCDVLVGLAGEWDLARHGNIITVFEAPFLENACAQFPYRAFWLPGWESRNVMSKYRVSTYV